MPEYYNSITISIQGSVGVEGVLNIIKEELKITMQLAGMHVLL